MKQRIVVLLALVVALGAIASWKAGSDRPVAASQLPVAESHAAKSLRSPSFARSARMEGTSEIVPTGRPEIRGPKPRGRTFILPEGRADRSEATAAGQLQAAVLSSQKQDSSDATGGEPQRAARGSDLAAQVVAHRRGRREFMSVRQAQLAKHTPGCRCAAHQGEDSE